MSERRFTVRIEYREGTGRYVEERQVWTSNERMAIAEAAQQGPGTLTILSVALATTEPEAVCECGHPESDHITEYWPKERMQCRAGGITEEDTGWQCTCTEYRGGDDG